MKKDIFNESTKLSKLSKMVRKQFECWNYEEIFLPFMEEYCSTFRGGLKYSDGKEFYLIKPDATSQIINRLKLKGEYRYFYFNEYFSFKNNCSIQFGAEFIGANSLQQKIEILSVVISILKSTGVKDFYIDIGSLKYLNDILSKIPGLEKKILEAIEKRNFSLVEELNLEKALEDELRRVFNFRGKKSGVPQLDEITENLSENNIYIDTGTIRYLDYYENIVFEIYSPSSGRTLGGGGDYRVNGMTGFGFSIDLKSLSEIVDFQMNFERKPVEGGIKESYVKASEMVINGEKVEVVL